VDLSRVASFRALPLIARLRKAQRDALDPIAVRVEHPRGAVLFDVGDAASYVGWVGSGVVRVSVPAGPRELLLHLHLRGQAFGESALVGETHRRHRAVAHEATVVWQLPLAALGDAARRALAIPIGQVIDARRRRLERRCALQARDASARLANTLLELAEDGGVRDSRGMIIAVRIAQREIAALVGVSRETVSAQLMALRRAGLVSAEERRLVLRDLPGLRALADPAREQ
jgi:CRP-like cAMP-binding protein